MKNSELENVGFVSLAQGQEREITGGFCGDLLSWAMARVGEGHVWFTVMSNINAIAVASLSEAAAIVLCHGVELAPEVKQKAELEGVSVFSTELAEYEAACLFYERFKG